MCACLSAYTCVHTFVCLRACVRACEFVCACIIHTKKHTATYIKGDIQSKPQKGVLRGWRDGEGIGGEGERGRGERIYTYYLCHLCLMEVYPDVLS